MRCGATGPSLAHVDPYGEALHAAVVAALPGWVERCVSVRVAGTVPGPVAAAAREAGVRAAAEVGERLRVLLETDVDAQRTNPLSILRGAVRHPTSVLEAAGVAPVERDRVALAMFPDDVYDLSPATWRDVDESLHEPGLVWGAWKAHVHLSRRRAPGRGGTTGGT